jgi:hypothetical protein
MSNVASNYFLGHLGHLGHLGDVLWQHFGEVLGFHISLHKCWHEDNLMLF